MNRHSGYLQGIFGNQEQFTSSVDKAARTLKNFRRRKDGRIDALVCRGVSGLTFASVLSYKTGIPVVVVRKEEESSHASYRVENINLEHTHYLFVDDFISSGDTLVKTLEGIKKMRDGYGCFSAVSHDPLHLVGMYAYNRDEPLYVGVEKVIGLCYDYNQSKVRQMLA